MSKRCVVLAFVVTLLLLAPAGAEAQEECYDIFYCWGVPACDTDDDGTEWKHLSGSGNCIWAPEYPCEGYEECEAPVDLIDVDANAKLAWADARVDEVRIAGLSFLLEAEVPPSYPVPSQVADWVAYQRANCPAAANTSADVTDVRD